jgi:c-di-GMP-binding flagellar brake protein YcgR
MATSSKTKTATTDPRRQYRLSSGLTGTLAVALVLADGTEHPAELVNVSASGTCLRCAAGEAVVLHIGQRVELHMQSFIADAPVTLHAAVRWLGADDEGNIRYGLEFRDLDQIFGQLSPTLWRLFNARNTRR